MRIVFMGTPDFAVPILEACCEVGEVVAVVSQPDKPQGRGKAVQPPPVKRRALERALRVLQPEKLRTPPFAPVLAELQPDVAVVAAYGKLLPPKVLAVPRAGCVNLHASLLPRFRGAAPIQRALEAGDAETGVCLMRMEEGLDTGPVYATVRVHIGPEDTSERLHDRLAQASADLVRSHLAAVVSGTRTAVAQGGDGVVHAPRVEKSEGRIDFGQPAAVWARRLRAFTPWPGLYTWLGGKLLKVNAAHAVSGTGAPGEVLRVGPEGIVVAFGEGALCLEQVQPEGKRPMTAAQFLAGHALTPGTRPFSEGP